MFNRSLLASLALALAGTTTAALAQDSTRQSIDPPRWYVPNLTPQDRYQTSVKEAAAALKEALDECRVTGAADKSRCTDAARDQHRNDVGVAKARLAEDLAKRG